MEIALADFKYKRVLLKLSGEALMGKQSFGIDPDVPQRLAEEIRPVYEASVQIAIVVGGGNIFRGIQGAADGMDRAQGDSMGMLATVINALALQDTFEHAGMDSRVMSAISMRQIAEPYIRRRAIRHMEKGRITILAAGTGNPYFTTDSGAALRACEVNAQILMKATNVDGVYTADPKRDPSATKYDSVTYDEVLTKNLRVMDAAAIALCRDNNMPIMIFDINGDGNFARAVAGDHVGTVVYEEKAAQPSEDTQEKEN